jgi:hypothetical protein
MKKGSIVLLVLAAAASVGFLLWLGDFLPSFDEGGGAVNQAVQPTATPVPTRSPTPSPTPAPTPVAAAEAVQLALPKELVEAKQKTDEAKTAADEKPNDSATLKNYRLALKAESDAYRKAENQLISVGEKVKETPPAAGQGQGAPTVVVHDPVLFGFLPLRWLIAAILGASVLVLIAQLFQFRFTQSEADRITEKSGAWFSDLKAKMSDLEQQQASPGVKAGAAAGFSKEFDEVYKRLDSLAEQIKKSGEQDAEGGGGDEHGSSAGGLHGNNNEQSPSQDATDSADGGPFPATAQELLDRTQGRGTVVKPDMHGILLPDSEGWLIVVERTNKPGGFYVIPKDTYFHPDVFAFGYKPYFNNNRDVPGHVHIIKTASAVRTANGWQVVNRGELETT